MKCKNCGSEIAENSNFCASCGAKVIIANTVCNNCGAELKADAKFCASCGAPVSSNNNIKQNTAKQNTKDRVFTGKGIYAGEVANMVKNYLIDQKLEAQMVQNGDEFIVQGKQPSNYMKYIKSAFGLGVAATVNIKNVKGNLVVSMGAGQWVDKVVGGAVAWFILWPALLTTAWGIYMQKTLFVNIEKQIENYLINKN